MGLAQNEYGENVLDVDMALAVAPHAKRRPRARPRPTRPACSPTASSTSSTRCPQAHAGLGQLRHLRARRRRRDAGDEPAVPAGQGRGAAVVLRLRRQRHRRLPRRQGQQGALGRLAGVEPVRDLGRRHRDHRRAPTETAWSAGGGGQSEIIDKPAFQLGAAHARRRRSRSARHRRDRRRARRRDLRPGQLFAGVEGTSVRHADVGRRCGRSLDEAKGGTPASATAPSGCTSSARPAPAAFHDITVGANGDGTTPGYPAAPGCDFATGWGVPDVAALMGHGERAAVARARADGSTLACPRRARRRTASRSTPAAISRSVPQVTHVGAERDHLLHGHQRRAARCCTWSNPSPSKPDAQGHDQPANGELHLADPFGVDITLGAGVPAFGYAFSPDGRWALFLTKTKTLHYCARPGAARGARAARAGDRRRRSPTGCRTRRCSSRRSSRRAGATSSPACCRRT